MEQRMKNKDWKRPAVLVLFLAMGLSFLQAQTIRVSGKVTDPNNEPLLGVNVMEKGTTNGTSTNLDGEYTLQVQSGSKLVFSFIGFVSQELTAVPGTLNVTMQEDAALLDEVIVVGYGVQKKSSLTGAVSQVKSEDMVNRTITRPEQALQGKTAGVQVYTSSARPGASPTIRIRGVSSNGANSPLFVVDGRISSDIGGIDPNDIESMEVLKDGASAAIYGAAAGNGVILITTRKGQGNGKITYDFQFTSQSLSNVPKVMNAEQYIDYFTEAGLLSIDGVYTYWDTKTNTNWVDAFFGSSAMQRHNLTFSAGNERGSLYTSMTYLNNDGMVVGTADTYERITGMINASWKIKPWLEIGTNNQIEYYSARSVAEGSEYASLLLSTLQQDPLTKVTYTLDDMPDYMRDIMNNSSFGELLSDGKGNYYGISPFVQNENINPLIMRDNSYSKSRGFNINGTAFINFTPITGLTVTSRFGYRLSGSESYGASYDYYATAMQHRNYMSVSASTYTPYYWQWENFLNYSRSFGKHNATLMLGTSYSESRSFGVNGSYSGGDGNFGFMQDDPLFYYFAYATASATRSLSGGEPSYSRKNAYFGRLNYDYAGKYMAQVSLRADAADSSVLPMDNRWGYFPAGSAGWVISEENFMEQTRDWLSHLKLRLSWGQNGSTASLGGYSYANVIATTGSYPTGVGLNYIEGYAPSSTGNDELKWETSEQLNIGFDARFLNNRLSLTFEYYDKQTKDLIVGGITPSTVVGNTSSPVNAGNITNKGIEIEAAWQDHIGDFSYGIRANMATLKNEVTYIHESLDALDGTTFHTYGAITRFEPGKPAWYFYGYQYAGIDSTTGDPTFKDLDGDGMMTDADKTEIGKGMPDITYGITLNAAWRGLDLIVFGTGSVGNDIYQCLNRSDYTVNKLYSFVDDRWSPTNTNGTDPRAGAGSMDQYMISDASVFDGSYFKIKQIQLGYTLPKSWMQKVKIENVRIYGSLEDFFTFTKYGGFDPEVTGVGNGLGVDKGSYPNSKKLVGGISITF
ncbi:MAG: TonB-dependent receptor [Prevotellaceae bacterium]|jgi:TonB-linked SusC/RagA family outer membrane protein|nr:TonB-dependent receptor [Prevotellaceae bacterium]